VQNYVPIFFAKEDLDVALGNAHLRRGQGQSAQLRQHADKLAAEYEEAKEVYASASDRRAKRRAKDRADKALAGSQKALERAAKVEAAGLPRIEVGCFEDLVEQMRRDRKGEFGAVMFIPPGAIAATAAAADARKAES